MSDDKQQQKQQQQAKSVNGIQVGANITPNDIYNPKTMAATFTVFSVMAGATWCLNKLGPKVLRFIFGVKDKVEVKPEINPADVVNIIKEDATFQNDSRRSWVMKECFGAMSDDGKARAVEWMNKQGSKE